MHADQTYVLRYMKLLWINTIGQLVMRPPAILSLCPVTDPTRPSQSLLGLLFATDQPGSVGRALTCSKVAAQRSR